MNLSVKKTFFLLTIVFFFFTIYGFSNAQEGPEEFETYELSGGEEDGTNMFLQKTIKEDNSLKTKAEQFNGARSGKYEGEKLACPYAFERDLFVGSRGEDVRLLQVLLNSDRRTIISVTGPGSLGQESDIFGESTKTAVKKFQALFIEYTGIANGRFGPRTRTVMNAICNGENKPTNANNIEARQNRNIYENIFSVQRGAVPGGIATTNVGQNADSVAPRVSLSANVSTIKLGDTFKVILNASEEIVTITPDSLIVDGGSVKEIRKLSKTSYSITINTGENVKSVMVQIEADKIEDLVGNKNENASNEVFVKVVEEKKIAENGVVGSDEPSINSLLDKIIASAPQCTYNGSGILVTIAPDGKTLNTTGCAQTQTQNLASSGQTYNCNGQQIPVTVACQNNQTQTVCTTTVNPFTGAPQQQCQQMSKQQLEQAQQAQQNQAIGQLLGNLLRGNSFGQQGQQGQQPGQQGPSSPGYTAPVGPAATTPADPAAPAPKPGTEKPTTLSETQTKISEIDKKIAEQKAVECQGDPIAITKCQTKKNAEIEKLEAEKQELQKNIPVNDDSAIKQEMNLNIEKICNDPKQKDELGIKSDEDCKKVLNSPEFMTAIKDLNKGCEDDKFSFYCTQTKCYKKEMVYITTSTNLTLSPTIYIDLNNKFKVRKGECIIFDPATAPKDWFTEDKFVGCATKENPNRSEKYFIPPDKIEFKYSHSLTEANKLSKYLYIYKHNLIVNSAKCPLK